MSTIHFNTIIVDLHCIIVARHGECSLLVDSPSAWFGSVVLHDTLVLRWLLLHAEQETHHSRDPGIGNSTIPNPGIENSSPGLQSLHYTDLRFFDVQFQDRIFLTKAL